jgi:hypothetical protein
VRPPRFPSGPDPSLNGSAHQQHRRWRHANKRTNRLYEVALAVKAEVRAAYRDVAVCELVALIAVGDPVRTGRISGGLLRKAAHLSLDKIAIQSGVPRQMIRRTVLNHVTGLQ